MGLDTLRYPVSGPEPEPSNGSEAEPCVEQDEVIGRLLDGTGLRVDLEAEVATRNLQTP